MRQITLAILGYIALNLVFPGLWEWLVNAAPPKILRILLFCAALACVGFIVFSDPVYTHLSQPKLHPIGSTIAFAMVVALIGASAWLFLVAGVSTIPKQASKPVVTVSPEEEFGLHNGQMANVTSVFITNHSDTPVYSVWIKIATKSEGLVARDIQIEDDGKPTAPPVMVQGKAVPTDIWAWEGIDPSGAQAVIVRFQELLPNSSRRLLVSGSIPVRSTAVVKGMRFKLKQEPLLTIRGKNVRLVQEVPEGGFTFTGMRIPPDLRELFATMIETSPSPSGNQ